MNKYIKPKLTLREAIAKENIGNILLDMSTFDEKYFDDDGEQED